MPDIMTMNMIEETCKYGNINNNLQELSIPPNSRTVKTFVENSMYSDFLSAVLSSSIYNKVGYGPEKTDFQRTYGSTIWWNLALYQELTKNKYQSVLDLSQLIADRIVNKCDGPRFSHWIPVDYFDRYIKTEHSSPEYFNENIEETKDSHRCNYVLIKNIGIIYAPKSFVRERFEDNVLKKNEPKLICPVKFERYSLTSMQIAVSAVRDPVIEADQAKGNNIHLQQVSVVQNNKTKEATSLVENDLIESPLKDSENISKTTPSLNMQNANNGETFSVETTVASLQTTIEPASTLKKEFDECMILGMISDCLDNTSNDRAGGYKEAQSLSWQIIELKNCIAFIKSNTPPNKLSTWWKKNKNEVRYLLDHKADEVCERLEYILKLGNFKNNFERLLQKIHEHSCDFDFKNFIFESWDKYELILKNDYRIFRLGLADRLNAGEKIIADSSWNLDNSESRYAGKGNKNMQVYNIISDGIMAGDELVVVPSVDVYTL